MENTQNGAADLAEVPSLATSLLSGAIGFGAASLVVFATVAFGEGWMYRHVGILGAYLAWTVLFIVLGGGALGPLVVRRWAMPKFFLLFAGAFFAYAVGWVASYFVLGGLVGEWVGSVLGSLLMATILAAGFGVAHSVFKLAAILFIANSLGYFLGSAVNESLESRAGMLSWGLLYGVFLGAGLGAVLHFAQTVGERTQQRPSASSAIQNGGQDDHP